MGSLRHRAPVRFGKGGYLLSTSRTEPTVAFTPLCTTSRDDSGASAAQVRLSLNSGQIVNFDSPTISPLACSAGDSAETLKLVDSNDVAANWPQRQTSFRDKSCHNTETRHFVVGGRNQTSHGRFRRVKRTCPIHDRVSAFDPKQTFGTKV
jgi:hypothetical protein